MRKMLFFPRHITVISFVLVLYAGLWKNIAGQIRDGAANVSQASSIDFTTVSSPIGPTPDSFFLRSLLRNCSLDMAQVTGSQWEDQMRLFLQRSFMAADSRYSCSARCGLDQRNASLSDGAVFIPLCYCDELCDDFGDCCFDFDKLCRKNLSPQSSNRSTSEICFGVKHDEVSAYHGYVIWNTCPKNWKERSVLQKCQDEDESDLLRNLPVFDEDSHVTYKNIFCARCNAALNTTYWKIIFDCEEWFNVTTFNFTSDLGLLQRRCSIDKRPKNNQLSYLNRCIPRFKDCHKISQDNNDSYCQAECLRYAFPVCVRGPEMLRFRNPQCALCNGFNTSVMESICGRVSGILPPLTIFFDFTSTSKYSIVIRDSVKYAVQQIEQLWSCSFDEVFDPYTGRCTKIVPTVPQTDPDQRGRNETEQWNPNCTTVIAFNESDYERLSNGSMYLKLHDKIYSNNTFTIRGKRLLLCANFSRNFTATERGPGMRRKVIKTRASRSLQLLTSIGCILSMISLILLLITYILFAELRNLPGKIIINLAISLLLYQSVYFSAVKNDDPDTCLVVAVLLHFFILSSFTWMNVMAYDVHRTFVNAAG
ncbi:uncharacterized protein LOC110054970 [Orbicella faveolata]|uniref:uncharacterized protein LOC110054970 n=1 Tax=Orbicella faveolata TaxID=48498 RepID=UPI0009E4C48D|nr:uncharacterized protein LOC110054970 [Orbicella faveolata]